MRRKAHRFTALGRLLRRRLSHGRPKAREVAAVLAAALATAACPSSAAAEEAAVHVRATVEPAVATIGDRLHYKLMLDSAEGVQVVLPDVVADLAPFEVLDAVLSKPEVLDGRVVETRDYVLAAFRTGELFLPALEFAYVTADGDSGVATSDSLAVTIESVLPEVREDQQVGPMDIKPPVELPRRIWPYVVAALAVAAVAAALYFLRRWLRGRTGKRVEEKPEEPVVPRIAAHVLALERLDALARDDPIGRGDVPGFYVRVTEIVRLYLRDRFGVDAIEMTTSELPAAMREARIEEAETAWCGDYLMHADLAKFARHVPTEERAGADFSAAREFVERTRLLGEDVTDVSADVGAGDDIADVDAGDDVADVAADAGAGDGVAQVDAADAGEDRP